MGRWERPAPRKPGLPSSSSRTSCLTSATLQFVKQSGAIMRAGRCSRQAPGTRHLRRAQLGSSAARPPQQLQQPQHALTDPSSAWPGAAQARPSSSSSSTRRVVATRCAAANSAGSVSVSATPPAAAAAGAAAADVEAAAAAEPSAAAEAPAGDGASLAGAAAASWEEEIEETLKLTRLLPPSGEAAAAAAGPDGRRSCGRPRTRHPPPGARLPLSHTPSPLCLARARATAHRHALPAAVPRPPHPRQSRRCWRRTRAWASWWRS